MKRIVKIIYLIISLILILYICIPYPTFPEPPTNTLQSDEPGDTENIFRRAYFTNLSREEVIKFYFEQFKNSNNLNIKLFTYRLNYPPEESKTLIRDQTRSSYLEEIVHPLRESIFVNGFEPKVEKDAIYINNKYWKQKIIIRYMTSSTLSRFMVTILTSFIFWFVLNGFFSALLTLTNEIKKIKWT